MARKAPLDPALLGPLTHPEKLAAGASVRLSEQHLRMLESREVNVKEAFTLVDAAGGFFRASLKPGGEALVYEAMPGSTESPARITLVCSVLSRQRMLVVVQKATELGCVRIVPVLSDHGVPQADLAKEKPWAWQGQALRASRQCRRAAVPVVEEIVRLDAALARSFWRDAAARFCLDDRAKEAPADRFATAVAPAEYVLAVGPEGGWSDPERARLEAAGAVRLALGARVLRAETAVFAGLSVLQHRLGDLR